MKTNILTNKTPSKVRAGAQTGTTANAATSSSITSSNMFGRAMSVAGGALGAWGSLRQGDVANQAAQANAWNFEQRAANAYMAGVERTELLRSQARQEIGSQVAMGADSGVELTGSRLDALRQSHENLNRDTAAIMSDADIDARGLKNQARLARWEGKQAKRAGQIGAITEGVKAGIAYSSMEDPYEKGEASQMLKRTKYGKKRVEK